MDTLGSRIRAARKESGLTVEQLAARAGITKGFLSDVERDRRNISVANCQRVAEALKVSLTWLATGNEKPYTCPFCKGSGVL